MAPNILLSPLRLLSLLTFLMSSILLPLVSSTATCSSKDTDTLLKIKKSFADSPSVASWNESTNCCAWENVGCNGAVVGTIIYINIYGSKYSGPIPESFGGLPALIDLYMTDVPRLSGPIPPFFANLKSLKSININNGSLSGPIPPFICNLPEMYVLDLTANRVTGPIPDCLGSKFATIKLGQNQLSGSIPPSIFRGKSIFSGNIELDLHDNQLSGRIPRSLAKIKFNNINLSRNRLAGDASFLFGTLQTTEYIDISRNELEFDLSTVKFPHKLKSIDISHNRITGRIPKRITKLIALSDLDVSYNRLCGPIPSGGSMSHLYQSAFDHNKCLCGAPLPPCNGTLGN